MATEWGLQREDPDEARHGAGRTSGTTRRTEHIGLFVNRVELIGNLGRDPDIRTLANGKQIVTLSIATSESWKDQHSDEWRNRTEWHRVVIFNEGLAKVAEKHLEKGMKLRVEGKLRTRKWQDQSGQDRYSTDIHIENFDGALNFDPKRDEDRTSGGRTGQSTHGGAEDDSDIPY